jgi:catechol 2,3-dioxygenase
MALQGINHVVLKVRNLHASNLFYQEILGMKRVAERPGMWFYHAGGHPHDLALVEVGTKALSPQMYETGLFHLCFSVSDEQALAQVYIRCQSAGVPILGTVDHTVMRSFYVLDPDGHVVELGVDVPQEEWAHLPEPFARDLAYSLPNLLGEKKAVE